MPQHCPWSQPQVSDRAFPPEFRKIILPFVGLGEAQELLGKDLRAWRCPSALIQVGMSPQSKETGCQLNPKQIPGSNIQVWKSANPGQRLLHTGFCFNCAEKI